MSAVVSNPSQPPGQPDSSDTITLEQLKAANYFLRTALEQTSDGMLILRDEDASGFGPRILFNNTQIAGLVCADPVKGLRDRFVTQLVSTQDDAEALLRSLRASRKDGTSEWRGGLKTLFGTGVVPCVWRIRAVQNTHGVLLNYTVSVRKVEAQEKAPAPSTVTSVPGSPDSRLRNENLAFSARGMAHDVNNILGIMGVKISQAALSIEPDSEVAALLDEALNALRRAQSLTGGVLKLSKDLPIKREAVDVPALIRETASMVRSGNSVKIDIIVEPGVAAAHADASRLGQVLQNLLINGIQAMNSIGRMEVIARNARVSRPEGRLTPGDYVEIIVRDRGPGMPPEVLKNALKESITNKPGGNGVGLVTCRRIIEDHQGDIRVSSLVGTGTEFTMFIPASTHAANRPEARKKSGLTPGEGIVLVVEDEPDLMVATVAVLKRCGYRVYATGDGGEAVDVYQRLYRANNRIDAVIMDFNLHEGISGQEATAEILAFDQHAKVIACSGDHVEQMRQDILAMGFCDVLPKPYVSETLSEIVHHVITRASRGSKAA